MVDSRFQVSSLIPDPGFRFSCPVKSSLHFAGLLRAFAVNLCFRLSTFYFLLSGCPGFTSTPMRCVRSNGKAASTGYNTGVKTPSRLASGGKSVSRFHEPRNPPKV
jgi:hypothetical protein